MKQSAQGATVIPSKWQSQALKAGCQLLDPAWNQGRLCVIKAHVAKLPPDSTLFFINL